MIRFPAIALALGLWATDLVIAPPALADADDDQAALVLKTAMAERCPAAFAEDGSLTIPPDRWEVTSPSTWGGDPEPTILWKFRCAMGAYNVSHVFLKKTELDGMQILSFAMPELRITHTDPEDFESPVEELAIIGWRSSAIVVNAGFDPETLELTEYAAWRGIGDASSSGVWALMNEGFTLIRYDVDASYDGESNPVQVYGQTGGQTDILP